MKHEQPAREVGLAVIGAGPWGENLIRVARESRSGRLVMIADTNARRLAPFRLGEAVVTVNARDVLTSPDVDAVIIATPAETHADLAVAALGAGKHAFVEKPLALDVADAERVAWAARESGKIAFVGHIVHYDPAYAALHDLVAAGRIGTLRALHALRHAETVRGELGAFWALGPHDVSFALRCAGGVPVRTSATRDAAADRTVVSLSFESGVVATIDVWGRAPRKARVFVAEGDSGVAVVRAMPGPSEVSVVTGAAAERLGAMLRDAAVRVDPTAMAAIGASGELVAIPMLEPLAAELGAFLGAVRRGERPPTLLEDGLDVTRVMTAADAVAVITSERASARRLDGDRSAALAAP